MAMGIEEFKEYLKYIIAEAFIEGVTWKSSGEDIFPMDVAIQQAQNKILSAAEN